KLSIRCLTLAKLIIKPLFDEVLHEILHALAFNTLLSSQETDAFSGVRSFFVVPLVFQRSHSLSNSVI
ncbi:hypothetical protein, partial [Nonomuraea typhae]|uniref:hypothetical protein n=1 Tax=Nonomuraea typhae TaxID=2603600 RepID=UPI001CA5276A